MKILDQLEEINNKVFVKSNARFDYIDASRGIAILGGIMATPAALLSWEGGFARLSISTAQS